MKLNPFLIKEIRQSKFLFFLSIGFGLLAGLCSILQARKISQVIDQVFLHGRELQDVTGILMAVFAILLLRAIFTRNGDFFSNIIARRIKQDLRHRLYKHVICLGPAYLRSEAGESEVRTGELINVATEGIDALDSYYSQYLPQFALAVLIPLTILIFVFPADFLSGIILLVTAPLLPIFMSLIGKAAETLTRKQWLGLSRMSAFFLDVIQGLATLKSLGRSKDQVANIQRVSEQYRQSTMGVLKVTFLSALVLEFIATLSTAVVAVEIGIRLLYGRMDFEQAFFILLLAPEFYLPLRVLGTRFHAAMSGVEAGKRIFDILDLPVKTENSVSNILDDPIQQEKSLPAITIRDVGYTYSDQHAGLQRISFDIPAGKMTALAGESGAGKTTISWLLLKFLQPQSGEILVNGTNLAEIPASLWWDKLAWVPQTPYLFNDTIAANIKLAQPDATESAVQNAARLAHADEFIRLLPQGYATLIGERGARLSAGQAQRIALARAFLKDAPLLILDEATSHLDPETDSLLRESLAQLCRGRTVVIIAHHRSTLSMADQVVQLSHGRIKQVKQTGHPGMTLHPAKQSSVDQSSINLLPGNTGMRLEHGQVEIKAETHPGHVLSRMLALLSPFTGRILLSILLGFATIASGIGLMATSAYIISAAALHPSIAELQVAIVGVRFFGVSRGVFRYLERLVSHDVTFRLLSQWRVRFYQALEPLAPARLIQYHSGDLLSRVMGDIGVLEGFYVRAIAPPLVAVMVTLVMGGFFNTFGSRFALIITTFLVFVGVGIPVLMSWLSHNLGSQLLLSRANLNKIIVDGIQGLPDLLTCRQSEAHIRRVDQESKQLTSLQSRISGLTSIQSSLTVFLANLCMLTVLVFAIQKATQDQLAGVMLGVLALGALMSFEAVQPLPVAAQHLEANRAAAGRLYELVDADPLVSDPHAPIPVPESYHLAVRDLSFQYPSLVSSGTAAEFSDFGLENITFSLPQGKHLSIIGSNGAGKTTLVNLLQRFWEYEHGSIQLRGAELHQYRQEDIRNLIASIPQNPYLFSTTIKENLLIARPDASDEDLIQAARAASLHNMIQALPEGYNTWVGEHGLRLSAGERQRLAIARVLLRNSPLLILDEPTSNLDPDTAEKVVNSIRELSLERSTITITQRLVGLDTIDEILVLKDGQIFEHGSHAELLARGGLFCQMWNLYNQII